MNIDHSILTLIVFTPLAGRAAAGAAAGPRQDHAVGRARSHAGHLRADAASAVPLLLRRQPGSFQFEQNMPWIASPAIRYHLGVDGLSMWLMVLTGLLAPLGVLISWRAIDSRKKLFYMLFLLQQVAMMGIFVSLDLFLYYAFWEMSLVPMTLLIATFGRTRKPPPRRHQVLPLRLHSVRAAAGRDAVALCADRAPSTCPRWPPSPRSTRSRPTQPRCGFASLAFCSPSR